MVRESLVTALQVLFHHLMEEKGAAIDRAALIPAYDGMVSGLYILTVSMPDGQICSDKIQCLIYALHEHVPQEERQSIAGVRVFDSAIEFDYYIKFGSISDACQVCEENLQAYSPNRRPELIPILVEA